MPARSINITGPRPYFAELPYYLWGEANYDSEGDCKRPTDREWTVLALRHRERQSAVDVARGADGLWSVNGDEEIVARAAMYLLSRCSSEQDAALVAAVGTDWDHPGSLARAETVRREFEQPVLAPFDNHFFWGSWKWVGGFATDCTWVGRLIMHSVVRKDTRAIPLCIDWLKTTRFPEQKSALSFAVGHLSGEAPRSPADWISWYDGTWWTAGAKRRFPPPDINKWLTELQSSAL